MKNASIDGSASTSEALWKMDADRDVKLTVGSIRPSSTNPRKHFDQAELEELAASIRQHGILSPLLVRPIRRLDHRVNYELVAGERRLRAAKLAGLDVVPCRVREMTAREAREVQLIENDQRKDLAPLERAAGYQALIDEHGLSVDEVANRVGKSCTAIRALLKLQALPELAKEALTAGHISPSTAEVIARVPDDAQRLAFACQVLTGRTEGDPPSAREAAQALKAEDRQALTYRAARELLHQHYMIELKGAPFDRLSLDLVAAAGSCDACPKRTGNCPDDYPDARQDVCLDPECYRAKAEAHRRNHPEALEESLPDSPGALDESAMEEDAGLPGERGPRPAPPAATRAAREEVLAAADSIRRPFIESELILAAWQAAPQMFGLEGFDDQHPDARKVDLCLHGRNGLMLDGVLVRRRDGRIEVADQVPRQAG